MEDINNTDAIGYDKLKERFNNTENNQDIAHDNVFDKLLADYFLSKRGQYVKANQLLEDLNKQFKGDVGFHEAQTDNDPNMINRAKFPDFKEPGLAFHKL